MAKVAKFLLRTPTLTASNFEALYPTDPILPVWKDLTPFQKVARVQKAGSVLSIHVFYPLSELNLM